MVTAQEIIDEVAEDEKKRCHTIMPSDQAFKNAIKAVKVQEGLMTVEEANAEDTPASVMKSEQEKK